MPRTDFHVFAITHSPARQRVFPLPRNVAAVHTLPLWGTEEPGDDRQPFSVTYARRMRTTPEKINRIFLPAFRTAVECLMQPGSDPESLAESLLALHEYSRVYDYATSMASRAAWDTFLGAASCSLPSAMSWSLEEITTCMRWLQRYLGVITVALPATDIVHASMAGLAAVPGVIAKLKSGTVFLLTEHGIHLRELYIWLRKSAYSEVCRRFLVLFNEAIVQMNYHFADQVTALGDFNRRWQIRIGANPNKIRIMANGVDPDVFYPRQTKPPQRPTVLTMARIYPLKGIDILLRAAAQVRERVPSVLFRILGEVADEAYHRRCLDIIRQFGLEGNVEFGVTSDPASAYNEAHIFCLPSISEGLPYSIIEAMSSGCPVVATNVGNVAELLDATGVVVRPNDPADLAAGLLSLLDGPAAEVRRAELSQAALMRASSHYTLRHATERMGRLYRELMHASRASSLSQAAD